MSLLISRDFSHLTLLNFAIFPPSIQTTTLIYLFINLYIHHTTCFLLKFMSFDIFTTLPRLMQLISLSSTLSLSPSQGSLFSRLFLLISLISSLLDVCLSLYPPYRSFYLCLFLFQTFFLSFRSSSLPIPSFLSFLLDFSLTPFLYSFSLS